MLPKPRGFKAIAKVVAIARPIGLPPAKLRDATLSLLSAAAPIVMAFLVVAGSTAMLNANQGAGWQELGRLLARSGSAAAFAENPAVLPPRFD
jgi:hypothetical protein